MLVFDAAAGALLAVAAATAGCGASRFDGTVYRGEGFAFRVPPRPASWQPLDVTETALAFRDDQGAASIAINGRCRADGEDVPLASLTQHLFLQFTERDVVQQEIVPMDGREAMHSTVVAKLDGVPKKFDVWVLKKDGCVYDFLYVARPDRFDAGVGGFRTFVRGFATVEP